MRISIYRIPSRIFWIMVILLSDRQALFPSLFARPSPEVARSSRSNEYILSGPIKVNGTITKIEAEQRYVAEESPMYKIKMIVLILVSVFFLIMGLDLLISAYQLKNPFTFVLVFFASNLMILISATLCLGFALRLKRSFKTPPPDNDLPDAKQ